MDNVARRVTSNFTWLITSDILFKGALFLGTLHIARVLGTAEFGLFSFALAVTNSIWIAVDLGVNQYGTRQVARTPDNAEELLRVLNSMRFVTSILVFGTLFLILTLAHVPAHKKTVLLASAIYLIAYGLSPEWLLRGSETMKYLAIGNLIMAFVFLPSIFLLVKDPGDTAWASFVWSFSFFFGSLGTIFLLWKKLDIKFLFTFSPFKWKAHLKESAYFAINNSLMMVYVYIPIILLGFLAAPEKLGVFSAAHRFVYTLINFNSVIPRAFYPVLASLYQDAKAFRKANYNFQKIMIAIGLPIGVGGTVLAKDIIRLLYGSSYLQGVNVFKILIWVVPLAFVRINYNSSLLVLGLQRLNAVAIGLGVLVMLVLNILLIPVYGIHGAALASLAGETTILFFMALIFSKRVYRSIPFDPYFLKVFIACVLMGVVIGMVHVNVVMKVILGALSYGVLSIALGITDRKAILGFYSAVVNNRKKV